MFGRQRFQNGIEGMTVRQQRMEDDEVAPGARSHGSQGAAPGTQLLHLHEILLGRHPRSPGIRLLGTVPPKQQKL
jgi:hypothetical protein